jgi:uncharacterized protein (DUF302 family)
MIQQAFRVASEIRSVERITLETEMTFDALVAAFEGQLGRYNRIVGAELVRQQASWEDVSATIEAMAGPHGLMIMSHLDLRRTGSRDGDDGQCVVYLVGNPLIASDTADVRAGMLVPVRVEITETTAGVMLSYDRPSASLASLRSTALSGLGITLDEKMDGLVAALASRSR